MSGIPRQFEIVGQPAYVQSWSAASIEGFVPAVLERWQRHHGSLPSAFHLVLCPQVELNARGGLPERVRELTDPRLRCRHFTGCHKPYFVVIFTDDDAGAHAQQCLEQLAWSECYQVEVDDSVLRLRFTGSTEDLDDEDETARTQARTLKQLLESGELVSILA